MIFKCLILSIACFLFLVGNSNGAGMESVSIPLKATLDQGYTDTALRLKFMFERRSGSLESMIKGSADNLDPVDRYIRRLLSDIESNDINSVASSLSFSSNARLTDASAFVGSLRRSLFPEDTNSECSMVGRIPLGSKIVYLLKCPDPADRIVMFELLEQGGKGGAGYVWSPILQDPMVQLLQDSLSLKDLELSAIASVSSTSEIGAMLLSNGFSSNLLVEGSFLLPESDKYLKINELVVSLSEEKLFSCFTPDSQRVFNDFLPAQPEVFKNNFVKEFRNNRKKIMAVIDANPCYFVIYEPADVEAAKKNLVFDTIVFKGGQCKIANFGIESNISQLISEITTPVKNGVKYFQPNGAQ